MRSDTASLLLCRRPGARLPQWLVLRRRQTHPPHPRDTHAQEERNRTGGPDGVMRRYDLEQRAKRAEAAAKHAAKRWGYVNKLEEERVALEREQEDRRREGALAGDERPRGGGGGARSGYKGAILAHARKAVVQVRDAARTEKLVRGGGRVGGVWSRVCAAFCPGE